MRQVGLFGGSFDPVHLAHLVLAECAAEQAGLERVIFMPARIPPHKPGAPLAPARDRLEMLRLASEGNPRCEVSRLELERDGPSYTLTTVRELKASLGDGCSLRLLLGSDSLREIHTWWRAEELVREVELVVFARPGAPLDDLPAFAEHFGAAAAERVRTSIVRAPLLEISSTQVRRRVREGRSIRYLVPEAVRRYILDRGLYAPA